MGWIHVKRMAGVLAGALLLILTAGCGAAHAVHSRVSDTAYGYSVPIPAGWKASGYDGFPTSRTAKLIMTPSAPINEDIMVLVCRVSTNCPDPNEASGFHLVSKTATSGGLTLGSAAAFGYTETWRTAADTRVWRQPHTVATHAGYMYDVYVDLPIGVTTPPPAYTTVVEGWRWRSGS